MEEVIRPSALRRLRVSCEMRTCLTKHHQYIVASVRAMLGTVAKSFYLRYIAWRVNIRTVVCPLFALLGYLLLDKGSVTKQHTVPVRQQESAAVGLLGFGFLLHALYLFACIVILRSNCRFANKYTFSISRHNYFRLNFRTSPRQTSRSSL